MSSGIRHHCGVGFDLCFPRIVVPPTLLNLHPIVESAGFTGFFHQVIGGLRHARDDFIIL